MCGMYSALIDALVSIRQRSCLCRGFTLSVSNWHVQPDSSLLSHTRLMCVCWIVLMTFTMWRHWIIYILATCSGIDVRIWEQAKLDNPDPTRMIPVPIIGFDELHQRLRLQEQQTSLHQARLEVRASFVRVILSILFNALTYFQEYFMDVIKYESQSTQQCIVNRHHLHADWSHRLTVTLLKLSQWWEYILAVQKLLAEFTLMTLLNPCYTLGNSNRCHTTFQRRISQKFTANFRDSFFRTL